MKFSSGLAGVLAAGLLCGHAARADVLFLDMNCNAQELKVAREAAAARGEKLVVIPKFSSADRRKIDRAKHELEGLTEKIERIWRPVADLARKMGALMDQSKLPGISPERKSALEKQANEVYGQYQQVAKSLQDQVDPLNKAADDKRAAYQAAVKQSLPPGFTVKQALSSALARADRDGEQFSSIIMSGHHTSHYYGDVGKIGDTDLFDTLAKHKDSTAQVSSFYGWGCYTGTLDNVMTLKSALPQLKINAGFDGMAPGETRRADLDDLGYLMGHEQEAVAVSDQKQLKSYFDQVPGGKAASLTLTVCNSYINAHETIDLNDPNAGCSTAMTKAMKEQTLHVYDNYLGAVEGYENVPEDAHRSILREYYTHLRKFAHCPAFKRGVKSGLYPQPDQLIPLIFYKNVAKNFEEFYRDDLDLLKHVLDGKHQALPDLGNPATTRSNMLDVLHEAKVEAKLATDPAVKSRLSALQASMDVLLYQGQCVPDHWIDPPGKEGLETPEASCLQKTPTQLDEWRSLTWNESEDCARFGGRSCES